MSDSEDYDDFGLDDLGYFFIEDAYAPADDLAEHTCPSPIPYEGDDDWDDHSRFISYWNDLKYNSDSYYDKAPRKKKAGKSAKSRKPKDGRLGPPSAKKRKTQPTTRSRSPTVFKDDIPPVMWVSQRERSAPRRAKLLVAGQPISLFGDWRQRFADTAGFSTTSRLTKLAEVHDSGDEGINKDEEGNDSCNLSDESSPGASVRTKRTETLGAAEEAVDAGGLELDPEALKMALRQHLQAAGINIGDMDEATLLQFATRMFANDSGADDIAGELADDLLGRDEDEEADERGFAGWVATQVDSKRNGAPTDDDSTPQQLPTPSQSSSNGSETSRGSLPRTQGAKRKAGSASDSVIEEEMPPPKRAARSFATPTAPARARSAITGAAASTHSASGKGKKPIRP